MMEKILPIIIMIEMFAASVPYFFQGKIGSGLYWFAAGLISLAIVFLMPKFG